MNDLPDPKTEGTAGLVPKMELKAVLRDSGGALLLRLENIVDGMFGIVSQGTALLEIFVDSTDIDCCSCLNNRSFLLVLLCMRAIRSNPQV